MTKPTRRLLDLLRIEVPIVIPDGPPRRWRVARARCPPLRWLHGLAVRTLVDQQVAEDIAQEVFVSLWSGLGRIEPERGTTAFRAGTCRFMTIPTPSWPTRPRCATATST